MLRRVTSATNASEIERLKQAQQRAEEKHAQQMALLGDITTTASEMDELTGRWHAQLAALADLSGSAAAAADISGLSRAQVETAVKAATPEQVKAAIEAAGASSSRRRRRRSSTPTTPAAPAGT
jgi:hypothetical protein